MLKGILTANDAKRVISVGADGIIVSNHGGRSVDYLPATLDVLNEIVEAVKAVNDKVEVYIDGGIRSGGDVFKALAMGAKGVFIGRPSIYGLIEGGSDGVKNVLEILNKELTAYMAHAGVTKIEDINRSHIKLH